MAEPTGPDLERGADPRDDRVHESEPFVPAPPSPPMPEDYSAAHVVPRQLTSASRLVLEYRQGRLAAVQGELERRRLLESETRASSSAGRRTSSTEATMVSSMGLSSAGQSRSPRQLRVGKSGAEEVRKLARRVGDGARGESPLRGASDAGKATQDLGGNDVGNSEESQHAPLIEGSRQDEGVAALSDPELMDLLNVRLHEYTAALVRYRELTRLDDYRPSACLVAAVTVPTFLFFMVAMVVLMNTPSRERQLITVLGLLLVFSIAIGTATTIMDERRMRVVFRTIAITAAVAAVIVVFLATDLVGQSVVPGGGASSMNITMILPGPLQFGNESTGPGGQTITIRPDPIIITIPVPGPAITTTVTANSTTTTVVLATNSATTTASVQGVTPTAGVA